MGFEVFRVELRGGAPVARVRDAILALPGVAIDPDGGYLSGEYFRLSDGRHVIELYLSDLPQHPLSVRFPLALPPTVDAAFLEVICHLVTQTGMRVRVLADVPMEFADGFSLADFDRFVAVVSERIARERRGWVAMFGWQPFSGSTADAFRDIILPRCEPAVVRQP